MAFLENLGKSSDILSFDASIPTTGVAGEGVWWTFVKDGKNQHARHALRVGFDLAVTAP